MEVDTGTIHHSGPWQLPYKATGVMCPDGIRRTVKLHHTPDTFWMIPGRLSFKRKTVSGVVFHQGMDTDDVADLKFVPQGKNRNIFEKGD